MTDRLTPERLAELRRIASYEENCNPNPEDLAVLIGEIDRLAAENEQLADFDAMGQRGRSLEAERNEAVQRWHDEHKRADRLTADLAEARRQVEAACCGPWHDYETSQRDEAAFPWGRVKAARAVADQWRTYAFEHIDGVPGAQTPGWAVALTALNLVCRELDDDGMRPAADPGKPHAAPQPHAPGSGGASAQSEPDETATEPQRPAEGFEHEYGYQLMRPGQSPMMIGRTPADILGVMRHQRATFPEADYALRRREVGPWQTVQDERAELSPYRPLSGLVLDEETARTGVLPAAAEDVMGLATGGWISGAMTIPPNDNPCFPLAAPRTAITPEDEGVSSADVMAQAAADEAADLRTLDQWEARYGVRVYDPDGWRDPADPKPWNQPLTLAEFWRRSRSSTTDAVNPAWTRVAADARRDTETESEPR